jgi:hypothetical protein
MRSLRFNTAASQSARVTRAAIGLSGAGLGAADDLPGLAEDADRDALVGGITYRHYAHRASLAFRAIMTLPQPSAFSAILRGGDSQCPCCRRMFAACG